MLDVTRLGFRLFPVLLLLGVRPDSPLNLVHGTSKRSSKVSGEMGCGFSGAGTYVCFIASQYMLSGTAVFAALPAFTTFPTLPDGCINFIMTPWLTNCAVSWLAYGSRLCLHAPSKMCLVTPVIKLLTTASVTQRLDSISVLI